MYFNELINAYDEQRKERNIYHDLMRFHVQEVLLVGSLYDSFVVEADGVLTEQIYGEYFKLNLSTVPRVTCAYTDETALDLFREGRFGLVILMAGLDFDKPLELALSMKHIWPDIPILLMATNNSSLENLDRDAPGLAAIDRIFVWNGYSKLFVGMIKYVEDIHNVESDTRLGQVRVILLVEDSIRYYSRYLPVLYKVVLKQTQNLLEEESLTDTYKLLAIRARPKILLASNYEEAEKILDTYHANLLTVIADVRFPRNGRPDDQAGFDFLQMAKEKMPELPIILQSSDPTIREKAYRMGAGFMDKNSESLEMELATYLQDNLGFGDFRFRMPDGTEIYRAHNLREFIRALHELPAESLVYHAQHNHFSAWLMARGEIQIAKVLKPYSIDDFPDVKSLRDFVVRTIDTAQKAKSRGLVPYFDETMANEENYICKLADGSVGGKGRGIVFIHSLLENLDFANYIQGIDIKIPRTAFIGIDEFEKFLESHNLWTEAFYGEYSDELKRTFLSTPLSSSLVSNLRRFLATTNRPLAVRSSGLFEDMLIVPFSGIYETYIIPNNHPDFEVRLNQLCDAVRLIYASLFSSQSRAYFEMARYNLEEERMAVVIQELVGTNYGDYYYPHISGIAQSYNYYPVSYLKPEDGLCVAALGLGTWVVGGGAAHRFSPRYPKVDLVAPELALENTQRSFHALNLRQSAPNLFAGEMASIAEVPVSEATEDRWLRLLASTWDVDDARFVPGVSGHGPRIIDFANILKNDAIPFANAISMILDVGSRSMGTPVEIEYALNFNDAHEKPALYILQIKPLIKAEDKMTVDLDSIDKKDCFLYSSYAMGNGRRQNVRDIIWVDPKTFDRSQTQEMASEIEVLNNACKQQGQRYILIGPGRWGTRDRWLGVPVAFSQIAKAALIAEVDLPDFVVDSSLGSHFFHNLTSLNIGYMKIGRDETKSFIDWDWLESLPIIKRTTHCVWSQAPLPLDIQMDGRTSRIAVLKSIRGSEGQVIH